MVYSLHTLFQHTVAMSSFSSAVKFDIEKFDGRINFGLWQIQVKDVLIQSGLHMALKGKIVQVKQYRKKALTQMLAMSLSL